MRTEVFRFLVPRPAQRARKPTHSAVQFANPGATGPFTKALAAARSREEAEATARAFIAQDRAAAAIDGGWRATLEELDRGVWRAQPPTFDRLVAHVVSAARSAGIGDWKAREARAALQDLRAHLADELLARVLVAPNLDRDDGGVHLVRLLKLAAAVQRAADASEANPSRAEVGRWLRARVDLTGRAFPAKSVPRGEQAALPRVEPPADVPPLRERATLKELGALRDQLIQFADSQSAQRSARVSGDAGRGRGWFAKPAPAPIKPHAAIPAWGTSLRAGAAAALNAHGIDPDATRLHEAIERLDHEIMLRGTGQPPADASNVTTKIGNLVRSMPTPGLELSGMDILGPVKLAGELDAAPTVPSGIGRPARPRRGELMLVRQTLKRYAEGEIAHIANVLQGESNERTHSTAQTTEMILTRTEETTVSEARDLQSTERYELKSEAKEAVQDSLKLEAGVSISASYGPTVGVEVGSQVAFEHAQEKSKEVATAYAREMTTKMQSRVETRVAEQRSTRVVSEVRELARHAIDNTDGAGHVRGVYRWVNKIYDAQLVNYGMRDLYDFYVPEPSAQWRNFRAGTPLEGMTLQEPKPPRVTLVGETYTLRHTDLTEANYARYVARYGAADVQPPPARWRYVSTVLEKGPSQVEGAVWGPAVKVSTEFALPEGYNARFVRIGGSGITVTGEDEFWRVVIGGWCYASTDSEDDDFVAFRPRTGSLPIGLVANNYWTLSVGIEVKCERTDATMQAWQLATFQAIMTGYEKQRMAYEEQVKSARAEQGITIAGANPAANERTIREELKRAALTMLTGQRFELFDAMRRSAGPHGYPEIALADAAEEGRYVAFFEQAFEWENMTFIFYPYFWGRKDAWPTVAQLDDADPLFGQFLRAGFARVQVPVRPGFEANVAFTLAPENWSGTVWIGPDAPAFQTDGALPIDDELRFQSGGDTYVEREGFVTLTNDSDVVVGVGTDFTDDDLDRELRADGQDFRILEVLDPPTRVRILGPLPARDAATVPYAVGPKLVGLPWEIVLPTTLVHLQANDALNPP